MKSALRSRILIGRRVFVILGLLPAAVVATIAGCSAVGADLFDERGVTTDRPVSDCKNKSTLLCSVCNNDDNCVDCINADGDKNNPACQSYCGGSDPFPSVCNPPTNCETNGKCDPTIPGCYCQAGGGGNGQGGNGSTGGSGSTSDGDDGSTSSGDGDGDTGSTSSGDGDGDGDDGSTSSGDGDGDDGSTSSGDGDGDGDDGSTSSGDGDGDGDDGSTSGDGDDGDYDGDYDGYDDGGDGGGDDY
jgi:hypothetical protein